MIASFISFLSDFHIILTLTFIAAAILWGDLKNWRDYYPTILYFMVLNFYYAYVSYNYPFWQFESPVLKTGFIEVLTTFIIFPATALIFLPTILKLKRLRSQVIYLLFWISIYMFLEVLSLRLGYFSHHNDWTIWWSLLFNGFMFPLLLLHHKKPLLSWGISLVISMLLLFYFDFPISSFK